MRIKAVALLVLPFVLSCGSPPGSSGPAVTATPHAEQSMILTSAAFKEGKPIPRQYTCDGVNISPPLEWSGGPKSARTIALIADDPDAPGGVWTHWILYNLPADNIGFVENVPAADTLNGGGFQGQNDFGKIGYGGPCPPSGTHRYFFKVYAIDMQLPLKPGATRKEVEKAIEGHVVGQAQLMGTYR